MVKRKSGEKETKIAEALGFIKSMKKNAPPENKILKEFLDEKERVLHENLFNCFFEKLNESREDV